MATAPSSSSSAESPEYSAMRENYDKLVDVLSPYSASLARTLFSKDLIPKAIMDKMRMSSIPEADKAGELLSHLMSRVKLKPSVFHKFVKALEEHDPSDKLIAEILMNSYKSYAATHGIFSASINSSESHSQHSQPNSIDLPQKLLRSIQSKLVLILGRQSSLAEPSLGGNFLEPQVQWDDNPQFGAGGRRDVLCTVSNVSPTNNPDIVPRRSRGPLTEEERRKLEEQGIHNFDNDLTIMRARGKRDNRFTLQEPAEKTSCTREGAKGQIANTLNNTSKEGGT